MAEKASPTAVADTDQGGARYVFPATFSQQRLWFLDQLNPGDVSYLIPWSIHLTGVLDAGALECALNEIVARHEILRTTFCAEGEDVSQVVSESLRIPIPVVDLAGHPDAEAEARRRQAAEARKPLDLERGPLVRAQLLRIEPTVHVLLLTLHHIIFDRWSRGIFTDELAALYEAFRDGTPSPLAPLKLQYADFAVWQRDHLQGKVLEDHLAYWKKQLFGAPEELALPLDRWRPAELGSRGSEKLFQLPQQLSARLEEFSRQHEVTLFMTLLAAFQALLSRYSGQDDIVVGAPIANRNRRELEGLIGFFANTLVLRADLSGNPSFRDLLARVKTATLDAYWHQDLPFERLVQELNPERRLNLNPVFQVLFSLGNVPGQALELKDLELRWEGLPGTTAKFDLSLVMRPRQDGLSGVLQYNTDLFDEATIDRMIGHFLTLIEGVVEQPATPVATIPLLSPDERHQQLVEWNDTRRDYPELCVHELFERQVRQNPDAVAVVSGTDRLTYGELNDRADRLASCLRSLGVGPDKAVGLCLERSLDVIVGLLGVLKAGGAYLPLDPAYPHERLAFMTAMAGAKVILTQSSFAGRVPEQWTTRVFLDRPEEWAAATIQPAEKPGIDHLAYLMYTSGSTGEPKAVEIPHRAVVRLLMGVDYANFGADEVFLHLAPLSFDASTFEIWGALLHGARLVLFPGDIPSTDELGIVLAKERVTTLWLTSSLFNMVMDSDAAVLKPVRQLLVGGEALSVKHIRRAQELLPETQLINGYGPTESTTFAVCHKIPADLDRASIPIGRPISNTTAYVLDSQRQLVPVGVAGELYLGGDGLARGYLGHPELTSSKFIPHPFSGRPSDRLYATGDLVRYLPDGNIEFLGRLDNQVKLRGFRIELGEIEAVLKRHAAVDQSTVILREDKPGLKRIVAYVLHRPGQPVTAAELRQYLRNSLPEYMNPAALVMLDAFPLTANGKVDRRVLPAPVGFLESSQFVAPQTPLEEQVADIWAKVLKLERVGRHDTFFELGGHSLLAVTVIERMRRLGLQVDVRTLFKNPTVAELSASVGPQARVVEIPPNGIPEGAKAITPVMLPLVALNAKDIQQIVDNVPGGAANVQDIYPLAPLQEGILFHHLMVQEGDPYLLGFQYSFDSRTRLDRYVEAMQAVMGRHDILRTAVQWEGLPEPVQVVWRRAKLAVEEVALDPGAGDIGKQLWARFNPRQFRIDVRQAPLLRVYFAHDPEKNRWLMMLLLHHLAGDHSTLDVMREEIRAELLGQADTLPAPQPFRNLVGQARLGVSKEEHEAFFKKLLGDVEAPTAPFGLLNVRGDGGAINEARRPVDVQLGRRLREQARKLGVSAASVFHLAWGQVLAKLTGRDDVVFGTVLLGRMQGGAGSDRVMGLFINTLPVRIGVGDGAEAALRRTHGQLAELLAHEHASLALAQRSSGVAAPLPLFTALLNYRHSAGAARMEERALEGVRAVYSEERTNYPFILSVDDREDGFGLKAQVDESIKAKRVCEYMHTALESLVDSLESAPGTAVHALEVLGKEETRKVLFDWNRTDSKYPAERCVHEWFERQARSTPEGIALIAGGSALTYGELNSRANRVAHQLRRHGAGPEVLIGICTDRSFDMVIAVLGVLKSGGAYVPLDPDYPGDRLAFILEDAGVRLLLTQQLLVPSLPSFSGKTICLDTDRNEISRQPEENPEGVGDSEHLAYVLYTSGSTGKPKGVQITHRNVVNFLASMQEKPGIGKDDSLLAVTTLSFDIAGLELFLPLVTGATVIIATREEARDGRQLIGLMDRWNPTILQATPATWWILLESGWKGNPRLKALCGGEALPGPLAAQLIPRCRELWNMYGPTETTIWSTVYRVTEAPAGVTTIGRPIANTKAYVLDSAFQPVPVGVAGELFLGGHGVARGYLNRPELNSQKFLPDPFVASDRMYRTGDLARYLSDGNLEYLGRADDQVKIRGFRVELGEIESTLDDHPEVKQSVVIVREDEPGRKQIVAYVLLQPGASVTPADLGQTLRSALPAYMIPSAVVLLDAFPLTANGKVNRKDLPRPGERQESSGYVAPRTALEVKMAAIWSDVLKLPQVGIRDDFFLIGGHSLLAVELFSRMEREFAVRLPLNLLFTTRTIKELVVQLGQEDSTPAESSIKPCRTDGSRVPIYAAHGIGGTVLTFRTLVKYLEPDQPVYCLEALGFDRYWNSLEDLAAIYVQDVRAFQPEGPYHLIGSSFGGMVVFEMARQLEAQGQEVGLVGLLDSYNMGDLNRRRRLDRVIKDLDFVSQRGMLHVKRLVSRRLSEWPRYAVGRLLAVWRRLYGRLWRFAYRSYKTAPANKPSPLRNYKRVYEVAGMDYIPKTYPGKVTLFRTTRPASNPRADQQLGWSGLADGGLEIIDIPGDHNSMISDPNAEVLAQEITHCLERYTSGKKHSEETSHDMVGSSSITG